MFITLEGIEGCGKTTLAERLGEYFMLQGKSVCITREPGGCSLGKGLRELLLNPSTKIIPESELFLFLADRAQHVVECIQPELSEGKIVICDRYIDSTIVYQGYGRGFEIEKLWSMNMLAVRGVLPEKTFVLDMDPEKALHRALQRDTLMKERAAEGRFELENVVFHHRIREGFLQWSACNTKRMFVLNADTNTEALFQQVCSILSSV